MSLFDILLDEVPTDVVRRNVWQLLSRRDRDRLRAVCKEAARLCVLLQNDSTSVSYIHTLHREGGGGEGGSAEDVRVDDIRHIMPLRHADFAFLGNIRHLDTLRIHVGSHLDFGEAPYTGDVQGVLAAHVAAVLALASAVDATAADGVNKTVGTEVRSIRLTLCTAQELWCISSQFTNLGKLYIASGVYVHTCAPLRRCQTLRELHVESLHADSYGSIGTLTQLRSLHLEGYSLLAEDAAETFRGWRHLTDLVDLKITVGDIEHMDPCDIIAASELFILTRLTSLCFMGVEYPTLQDPDDDDPEDPAVVATALAALGNMSNLSTLILGEAFTVDTVGLVAIARISGLTCLGVGHVLEQDECPVGLLTSLERLMVRHGLMPSEMMFTLSAFAPLANLVCVQLQACDVVWKTDKSHVKLHVACEFEWESAAEQAALGTVALLLMAAPKLQLAAIDIDEDECESDDVTSVPMSEATSVSMRMLSVRFPGLRITLDLS